MIKYKVIRGTEAQLPSTYEPFVLLYTTDTKNLYISGADGVPHLVSDPLPELSPNMVVIADASGNLSYSANVTTMELEYLDGVTDNIQTQLNNKANKATTLSGYGITDAINSTDVTTTATANKLLKLDATAKLPASVTGNASTATKLETSRTITLSGDASASAVSFDGSANITINTTLANSGVVAGTYPKVTVDAKGRVTTGANLSSTDIPSLNWSKITTGKPTTLSGYGITDSYTKTEIDNMDMFVASSTAPANTSKLWIDTSN